MSEELYICEDCGEETQRIGEGWKMDPDPATGKWKYYCPSCAPLHYSAKYRISTEDIPSPWREFAYIGFGISTGALSLCSFLFVLNLVYRISVFNVLAVF